MTEDKTKKATALHYNGQQAPKVVAKGVGLVAEEIVRIAKEHDVFIHEDPVLIDVLQQLELGDEIPEKLYLAVAKIIAFAYGLQEKVPDSK
jgi:flagellar biosynthesis protein